MRWISRILAVLLLVALVVHPTGAVKGQSQIQKQEGTEKELTPMEGQKVDETKEEGKGQQEKGHTSPEASKSPMQYWKDIEKKLFKKTPKTRTVEPSPGSDLRQMRQPFR
jgi:hypothetical protein